MNFATSGRVGPTTRWFPGPCSVEWAWETHSIRPFLGPWILAERREPRPDGLGLIGEATSHVPGKSVSGHQDKVKADEPYKVYDTTDISGHKKGSNCNDVLQSPQRFASLLKQHRTRCNGIERGLVSENLCSGKEVSQRSTHGRYRQRTQTRPSRGRQRRLPCYMPTSFPRFPVGSKPVRERVIADTSLQFWRGVRTELERFGSSRQDGDDVCARRKSPPDNPAVEYLSVSSTL